MTKTRPTGRYCPGGALDLGAAALLSLLCWQVATAIFERHHQCAVFALMPLLVVSFRLPLLGRVLGWGGMLAQIAVVVTGL